MSRSSERSGRSARPRSSAARRRLHALAWRSRPVVVAVGCGLAAAVVVGRVSPPPPETSPVVVAARDVGAGVVLTGRDLRVEDVVSSLAPQASLTRVSDAVGRTTSVALTRAQPVTPSLVAAGDLAASAPSGTVVAPVRLADPAVSALLGPGDRVDLLVAASGTDDPTGGAPGTYVARRALVLAGVPAEAAGGLLGGDPAEDGVTLVAVLPDEAASLAGLGQWGGLSAVLVQ
ncbi:SAF domain-containing protein [Oerskovia merdavium]|uniref:Flagellar biosynthesis protein FlgA n=1 Tax=Oerskovia merdavium TaxID=2762227 RepID=A0ABR8TUM2_9CELL|nr:SAF domain-containing protein [Oerskovia merdavium]MBD7979481.1 flagellar biosynthesis protein FlgA [Oerskovia merdavium]